RSGQNLSRRRLRQAEPDGKPEGFGRSYKRVIRPGRLVDLRIDQAVWSGRAGRRSSDRKWRRDHPIGRAGRSSDRRSSTIIRLDELVDLRIRRAVRSEVEQAGGSSDQLGG